MTLDPEIHAMSQIAEALSELEVPAAERVLRWAIDKYGSVNIATSIEEPEAQVGEKGIFEYSDFSELFDAATPSTEFEKVLVASYWFQEMQKLANLEALPVNNALKQLGHGVGNITREFTRLQTEKPSLIMQVQKKGSSKQARKQYKVTVAGKRRVENMISGMGE